MANTLHSVTRWPFIFDNASLIEKHCKIPHRRAPNFNWKSNCSYTKNVLYKIQELLKIWSRHGSMPSEATGLYTCAAFWCSFFKGFMVYSHDARQRICAVITYSGIVPQYCHTCITHSCSYWSVSTFLTCIVYTDEVFTGYIILSLSTQLIKFWMKYNELSKTFSRKHISLVAASHASSHPRIAHKKTFQVSINSVLVIITCNIYTDTFL